MKFVPNYTVSYKGEFYGAGIPFEIDAADREEMSKHGAVQNAVPQKRTKKQVVRTNDRNTEN